MEMNKYQRGKIYKIVDNTTDNIYIGSTCEPTLARRLSGHVRDYKRYLNGKYHYVSSFDIISKANYDIVLVELFSCQTKDELLARERHYKDTLDCVNKNRPIISNIERKEQLKNYDAKRIETKFKCICGGKYCGTDKTRHFRSQKHVNYIKQQQLLTNHNKIMTEIDNLIEITEEFIKRSENFIKRHNILK